MVSEGELTYYDVIGDESRSHAANKPFSDVGRGRMMQDLGALLSVLPSAGARVLDCGCGAGWLTWLLQKCGYETTGVDVAPAAINLARDANPYSELWRPPTFEVRNVEELGYDGQFDAVIFFDALHHSQNETNALRSALRALVPGGVCITSEPGKGHGHASAHEVEQFGVTERDMPAKHIARTGLDIGFRSARILPRAGSLGERYYPEHPSSGSWKDRLRAFAPLRAALTIRTAEFHRFNDGMVVLRAPGRPARD